MSATVLQDGRSRRAGASAHGNCDRIPHYDQIPLHNHITHHNQVPHHDQMPNQSVSDLVRFPVP